MTPEEIDFFKWYAANVRELITMDAITTPKRNKAELILFFVAGFVLHYAFTQMVII